MARKPILKPGSGSLKPGGGSRSPFKQLNARLPQDLVLAINTFAQAQGRFRDATLEQMLRSALADAQQQPDSPSSHSPDAVVVEFSFPENVKTACRQYLLYFGEFLRDVGIRVTTELSDSAGGVLFTVTPQDPHIALAKIHEALAIYLSLPQLPVRVSPESTLAEQRLQGNLDFLAEQLRFVQAVAASHELRLRDHDARVASKQQPLSSESTGSSQVSEREEVWGGVVAITKLEGKGVTINLAEIFRRVKALFNKRRKQKTA